MKLETIKNVIFEYSFPDLNHIPLYHSEKFAAKDTPHIVVLIIQLTHVFDDDPLMCYKILAVHINYSVFTIYVKVRCFRKGFGICHH